jgi:hypothetical protein
LPAATSPLDVLLACNKSGLVAAFRYHSGTTTSMTEEQQELEQFEIEGSASGERMPRMIRFEEVNGG